ncbi:RNA polymerase epsilon subunit [Eupransor demetentiae]|uniref:DNA-directed RNA polymerase subunit epsilon n=1 Tax=Eupransor demetentiae TaxID=3109584 RepID=A0ABP0ERI5_9LACO|nr:DNA-dependent RNA polymerase auxiliary subunit epsilon (RpoEps) [Lactobacillaceae bacterium LMG 33000]
MVFKVYYQEDPDRNPIREDTQVLYIEAEDLPQARAIVQKNTNYNVEEIEALSEKSLLYEESEPNYKLTTF